MSLASTIHLIIAMTYGTLAWLLWWRAVPTLKAERGDMQAWGAVLTGLAMVSFISGRLDLAMLNAPLRWSVVAGDVFLIAATVLELIRVGRLGFYRWNRCPDGSRP